MSLQATAREIARLLGELDEHRSAAVVAALAMTTGKAATVAAVETKRLRAALDGITGLAETCGVLLDQLECDAGLVDPTGRRYDEPAPARLQSVETSRVCLACQQSSTGRCSAHGGEAH